MNISRLIITMAILFCAAAAQAQSLLHLTIAQGHPPSGNKVYGNVAQQAATTLSVVNGQQVVLQRKTGSDYRLQGTQQSWAWTQIQQVAANETYIALTPRQRDGEVAVEIAYSNTQGDNSMAYSSTVSGELGSWIVLIGDPGRGNNKKSKIYTAGDLSQQLSLKIEQRDR
jgi:hypothetical protein